MKVAKCDYTMLAKLMMLVALFWGGSCTVPDLRSKDWSVIDRNSEFEDRVKIENLPEQKNEGKDKVAKSMFQAPPNKQNLNTAGGVDNSKEKKYQDAQKLLPKAGDNLGVAIPSGTSANTQSAVEPALNLAAEAKRRPDIDPFIVGEKVKFRVTWFGIPAGYLILEVLPFVMVNGRKSYQLKTEVKSHEAFAWVYTVHNNAVTFLDFENLVPYTYTLNSVESNKMAEEQTLFDWQKLEGTFWEKKVTKKHGKEKVEISWPITPFAQNVFSAAFYLRTFPLANVAEVKFPVANKGDNIIFSAKVIGKERITVPAGEFATVIVQPQFQIGGNFQPIGAIYLWLTDDASKLIVKIKSKIKIGSLLAEAEDVVMPSSAELSKNIIEQ